MPTAAASMSAVRDSLRTCREWRNTEANPAPLAAHRHRSYQSSAWIGEARRCVGDALELADAAGLRPQLKRPVGRQERINRHEPTRGSVTSGEPERTRCPDERLNV